jgi:hypothetical protein
MCVHGIPKAATFGKDGQWQICQRVRKEVKDHLSEQYNIENIYEYQIDDVIKALFDLGYVILS